MSLVDFDDGEIVSAVWRLISPNNQGEGGIETGVRERSIWVAAYESATLGDAPSPSKTELRDLTTKLIELTEAGRLVRAGGGWRTPTADPEAMFTLTMKGEKHTYSFRGSLEHDAKVVCATLADLTGFRADYLEAVFIAALKPGKKRTLGKEIDTLKFIVERTA